jgi:hypothetical protein
MAVKEKIGSLLHNGSVIAVRVGVIRVWARRSESRNSSRLGSMLPFARVKKVFEQLRGLSTNTTSGLGSYRQSPNYSDGVVDSVRTLSYVEGSSEPLGVATETLQSSWFNSQRASSKVR